MKFVDFLNESAKTLTDKDVEKLIEDELYHHVGEYVKGTLTLVKENGAVKTFKFVQSVKRDPEAGVKAGFAVSTISVDKKTCKVVDEKEGTSKFATKAEAIDSFKSLNESTDRSVSEKVHSLAMDYLDNDRNSKNKVRDLEQIELYKNKSDEDLYYSIYKGTIEITYTETDDDGDEYEETDTDVYFAIYKVNLKTKKVELVDDNQTFLDDVRKQLKREDSDVVKVAI